MIRVRRRPRTEPADQGSMPMALLISLVAMVLSATLVPIVVGQITDTRTVSARTHALESSQTGINVALGQLRSAAIIDPDAEPDAAIAGDLEKLPPCEISGTASTGWGYRVTIVYNKLAADGRSKPTPQACPPNDVPVTADLIAIGGPTAAKPAAMFVQGDPDTRTIEATFTFKTTNANVSGGAIQLADTSPDRLCMDGASGGIKMEVCQSGGTSDQRFEYDKYLNLRLVGSVTALAPYGMCLDARPHVVKTPVRLQRCLGGRFPRQQWSLNDSSNFVSTPESPLEPGDTPGDLCINLVNPGAAGSDLELNYCGGVTNRQVFRSQPGVGAGMASADTGQLVNFKQFSRCLDVTNFDPNSSYMIVWFCKQTPRGRPGIPWNQQWTIPAAAADADTAEPGHIRTAGSGNPGYCLRSPGVTNQYVTMTQCDDSGALTDPYLTWTVYGSTGNYATSYRIVDSFGYCMTPTDLTVATPDTHSDGTAKVKVVVCDSSELQKWNAPADFNKPRVLTNTIER